MKSTSYVAAGLSAVAVLACSSTYVRTDRDPAADLADYRTFEIKKGEVIAEGRVDERDTLVHGRVQQAIKRELAQKGLTQAAQTPPDLIVTYTAGGRRVPQYYDDAFYDPYYGVGANNPGWVEMDLEGTLVIDLLDAKTNKLVWRSIVEIENDDLRSAKTIGNAVDKGLEKYPAASVGAKR